MMVAAARCFGPVSRRPMLTGVRSSASCERWPALIRAQISRFCAPQRWRRETQVAWQIERYDQAQRLHQGSIRRLSEAVEPELASPCALIIGGASGGGPTRRRTQHVPSRSISPRNRPGGTRSRRASAVPEYGRPPGPPPAGDVGRAARSRRRQGSYSARPGCAAPKSSAHSASDSGRIVASRPRRRSRP